jgi:signal recognition particle receptor subunit beta
MVFFNYALRKLNAKIVYYGPGLCGKTTNLTWIHDNFEGGERGRMISLATEGDRTIFFDLLPIEIGSIRGMDVTLQLYTVPGQVHYNSTRQLVLRGADGVVFVGDSQRAMQSSNIDSFKNLQENLLLQGISLDGFPHALQFNKRDLKDIVPVEELDDDLNVYRVPIFEAVATAGIGVQETLEGIVKLVMRNLRERYEGATTGARTPGVEDSAVSRPPVSVPEMPPGPTAVPTPEQPLVAPLPPADQPPATAAPLGGQNFSPETGAETTDFSKTMGPETFGDGGVGGFEDEVATGVYNLGDEETGHLQNLGRPSQPDMPAAEEPGAPEATSTPDYDVVGNLIDGMPPPPVLEVGGAPFADIPSDPGMMAPDFEEVAAVDEIEDTDFELDPPSDGMPPEFEALLTAAEPAAPEFEAIAPATEPEIPEFEVSVPPSEPEIPAFEAIAPPTEPEVPEFEAASLSVEPEPSDFMETPITAEPEIPEIEFISTPGEEDAAPPAADLPPPSERYEDRIEAPSPFAPQPAAVSEDTPQDLEVVADGEAETPADAEGVLTADEVKSMIAEAGFEVLDEAEPEDTEPMIAEVEAEVLDEVAAEDVEPVIAEAEVEAEAEPEASDRAAWEPVVIGEGDPWSEEEITGVLKAAEVEIIEEAAIEPAGRREIAVRAEDNQLHLRLQGSGAIVESGQMRELEIEVPVPGSWVGNRRVTLQLRLTLIPDTEDENGGSGDPS